MRKYRVFIPVETCETYEVEAENEEHAKELIAEGNVEAITDNNDFYEADSDSNNWVIEEV